MEQLETPRLILRGFVMEDLDDFYSYCSDSDVGIHGGREAHQDREQSTEELRKRIGEDKTWAICKKESGKNIGMVRSTMAMESMKQPSRIMTRSTPTTTSMGLSTMPEMMVESSMGIRLTVRK